VFLILIEECKRLEVKVNINEFPVCLPDRGKEKAMKTFLKE
jgi:hypothetical protein